MSDGVNCSICLDALRQPVAIPCGHLHCERCLSAHIRSGSDALKSSCPTCRAQFYTASPDLAYVPKKYHDFILPSVRRIYLDTQGGTNLNELLAQIEQLQSRNATLEGTKGLLMDRCEALQRSVGAHSEGERKARVEADKARVEAVKARAGVEKAREDLDVVEAEFGALSLELDSARGDRDLYRKKYDTYKGKYTALKDSNARLNQPEIGTKRKNNSTRAEFPLAQAQSTNYTSISPTPSQTSSVLDSPPPLLRLKRPLPRARVVSSAGSLDDLDPTPVLKRSRLEPLLSFSASVGSGSRFNGGTVTRPEASMFVSARGLLPRTRVAAPAGLEESDDELPPRNFGQSRMFWGSSPAVLPEGQRRSYASTRA